jgi:hypothetical protein
LITFLVWAGVAKLRPDLDEPEFDLDELEKLKKLACEQSDFDPSIGDAVYEDLPAQAPPRRAKRRRQRLFQNHKLLFHTRKHRST